MERAKMLSHVFTSGLKYKTGWLHIAIHQMHLYFFHIILTQTARPGSRSHYPSLFPAYKSGLPRTAHQDLIMRHGIKLIPRDLCYDGEKS